ncbi:MAG: lipopolysaccharide heptosyltransferase II [Zetaproteobacteria bacterium]|nr:MAG: lipopolysaccharide heptosyltransferase II [Zetaproteobacteria bacterium]
MDGGLRPGGHLVIHPPNWLGDVVMAQPAMAALVAGLAPARVTLVGRPWLAELAPWLGLGAVATAEAMPRDGDLAVLFPHSIRVAWMAWRAGIPERIGFRGQWRRALLTRAPRPALDMMREHHRDYFLDLVAQMGLPIPRRHVALSVPQEAVEQGEALLRRHGLDPGRVVAIAPGAQFGGAKRYPPERYHLLARRLAAAGRQLLILGTAAERAIGEAVLPRGAEGWNGCGRTTLAQALRLLAACRLLLCNDSGLMHVAAGIGRPVVALFGATDPARTAPDGPQVRLLYRPAECSPCLQRECRVAGHPCMAALAPEEVAQAVEELLAG